MSNEGSDIKVDYARLERAKKENIVSNKISEFKFPECIREYFLHSNLAPTTKLTRVYAIQEFLQWLINSRTIDVQSIEDLTLKEFAAITSNDVEKYWLFLLKEPINNKNNNKLTALINETHNDTEKQQIASQYQYRSQNSVNTTLSACRALFSRWKKKAIKKGGSLEYEPFKISPWEGAEAPTNQERENIATKRARIMDQMYSPEEMDNFFEFMMTRYPDTIQKYTAKGKETVPYRLYKQNVDRDIALIALLNYSGMRISEALSLSMDQINLNDLVIRDVQRKENVRTTVNLESSVVKFLGQYLETRKANYLSDNKKGTDDPFIRNALFLSSTFHKEVKRFTPSGARTMIQVYSTAFGKKTSPHKFRHGFTTSLLEAGATVTDIQQALGQTTTSATEVYMHSSDERQKKLLRYADKKQDS